MDRIMRKVGIYNYGLLISLDIYITMTHLLKKRLCGERKFLRTMWIKGTL
jgi:hypothetical protein